MSRHYNNFYKLPRLIFSRSTSLRVDMRLQQLYTRAEMFQSQSQSANEPPAMGQMQKLETLMRQMLDGEHCSTYDDRLSANTSPWSNSNTSSNSSTQKSTTRAHLKHTSTTEEDARLPSSPPFRNVQLQFALSRRCNSTCRCSCHIRHYLKSPTFLNRVLGSLSICYRAIPRILASSCDILSCLKRPTATV